MLKPVPFWGLTGHFPAWFPDNAFYLVSAAGLWWRSRGKFVKRSYPLPRTRMFLDCGGFSFFSKYAEYPFSPDEYLRLVEHGYYGYRPLLWASMDYPCEPEIRRDHNLMSNQDRIEATIDHLAYLSRCAAWPGLVAVVQGYTLEERLACCEQIYLRGLQTSLMGIGSLCTLESPTRIAEQVEGLAQHFPAQSWHLFGVKISYFSLARYSLRSPAGVFSFDTAAWELGTHGEPKRPRNELERQRWFYRYQNKVRSCLAGPR